MRVFFRNTINPICSIKGSFVQCKGLFTLSECILETDVAKIGLIASYVLFTLHVKDQRKTDVAFLIVFVFAFVKVLVKVFTPE